MHTLWCLIVLQKMSRSTTKQTKFPVHPAKTYPPVLIKSLLLAWRNLVSLATQWAHSEDSDQIGRMPRLIWVFAGCKTHFARPVARSYVRPPGVRMVTGSSLTSDNILSWCLVMKKFLRPFSPFHWFKKGSCQLLAKEYALSTCKLLRSLAQEQCG